MNDSIVLFNGHFVTSGAARVSIFDGGWLHGAGLFETMRAEGGRVFRLEAHVERLRQSAAKLLRPMEREELPLRTEFLELLERNRLSDARIRLTVSAGSMTADSTADAAWTVCVSASPLTPPSEKIYQDGAQVALCSYRISPTDPIAGHKSTSHLPRLLGLREAQKKQCMEALWFTTRNTLAEGCISNVFLVKGGKLKTPPLDTPVLPGVARGVVLELAREMSIECGEAALSIDDLLDADEVFLTNVIMQVTPVSKIERHDVGSGKAGSLTMKLRTAFREVVRAECGTE